MTAAFSLTLASFRKRISLTFSFQRVLRDGPKYERAELEIRRTETGVGPDRRMHHHEFGRRIDGHVLAADAHQVETPSLTLRHPDLVTIAGRSGSLASG